METELRQKKITVATIIGTVIDFVLSILKVGVGFLVQSPALIADGFHSTSDLITDVLILWVARISGKAPDDDHPYGHQRFETIATAILGVVLLTVAGLIFIENIAGIINPKALHEASALALIVVVISLVGKEWLFHYTMKIAVETNSTMLKANAWHSRSDSLSSLVVLLGILLNFMGVPFAEPITAIIVALIIAKMAINLFWQALQELADKAVDLSLQSDFKTTILAVNGVIDVHQLRTRHMANHIVLDAHIQVPPKVSVSEGHQISDWVCFELKNKHKELHDITIHVDYEKDVTFTKLAPLRNKVEDIIIRQNIKNIHHFHLHYSPKQTIEIHFYLLEEDHEVIRQCQALVKDFDFISDVQFYKYIDASNLVSDSN
ncbi:cation diffusion facilitator family transporter [Marinicellulosiphila megalodicopiae]|uniref:cation diffusion facilitator family transporter n=1 Tax=Marinicellulosiphila megalodicopiae TaxID=2724896 RepID=UPI003BB0211F